MYQPLRDKIRTRLYCNVFCFLLVALPLYLMGCDSRIGGYCANYTSQNVIITDNDCAGSQGGGDLFCLVGTWNTSGGIALECYIQTHVGCDSTPNRCRVKYLEKYPVGSELQVYVGKSDDTCRTTQFTSNLAIAGFICLLLMGVCLVGGVVWMMVLVTLEQTTVVPINNTELVVAHPV